MCLNKYSSLIAGLLLVFAIIGFVPNNQIVEDDFSQRVKIGLRAVGNQLLLANKDSTSRVMPVIQLNENTFQLSFENALEIIPNDLLLYVEENFNTAKLPKEYRVEVLQCSNGEVAYSYQIKTVEDETLIPCRGRALPPQCYQIQVYFLETASKASSTTTNNLFNKPTLFYILLFVSLVPVSVLALKKRKTSNLNPSENAMDVGIFKFYPEQHLLVKNDSKTSLSKKECELLTIFVAKPNQIIPREELSKKVWEDHGVVVGRSLDTYISKLRKKLQADPNIQLSNIHGIGYKLEIF